MLISAAAGAALQLGLVLGLCAVAWLAFARRRCPFRQWLGLYGAPIGASALGLALGVAAAIVLLSIPAIHAASAGPGSVPHSVLARGSGIEAYAALAVLAIFKTALTEELLFRGLLGKRLIARFGFVAGNAGQAALFGLVHLMVALSPLATPGLVAILVVFTAFTGFLNGWLNEKWGGGSILPGWAAHAGANLIAYFTAASAL